MIVRLASSTAILTIAMALATTGANAQTQQGTQAQQGQAQQTQQGTQAQQGQNQQRQTQQQARQQQNQQVARECLRDMQQFAQQVSGDGFWMSGWGAGGYGTATPQTPANQATPQPGAAGQTGTTPQTGAQTGTTAQTGMAGTAADPRAQAAGMSTPRVQIHALYNAGHVLAQRGDREGCEYIVAKMHEVYDDYSQRLQEAGVDPESVTTWRQEQLALAQPLAGSDGMLTYRVDEITGTDVRNPQDQNLGSVSDVIIDANDGSVAYVLVARGGFLGIGEDHYAIPWQQVRATPGLDTIVVDRTEAELEQAPTVDPARFNDPQTMRQERQQTDQFWGQS